MLPRNLKILTSIDLIIEPLLMRSCLSGYKPKLGCWNKNICLLHCTNNTSRLV